MKNIIKTSIALLLSILLVVSCDHAYMVKDPYVVSFDAGVGQWDLNAKNVRMPRADEETQMNGDFIAPDARYLNAPQAGVDGATEDMPNFIGWEYNGRVYRTGDLIRIKGPATLVARWEPNREIRFVGGEGSDGSKPFPILEGVRGTLIALPMNAGDQAFVAPTDPVVGREFAGWNVKMGDQKAFFAKPGTYIRLTDNAVATALWTQVYKITYYKGFSAKNEEPSGDFEVSVAYSLQGRSYTLPEPKGLTAPPNCSFGGWLVKEGPFEPYERKAGAPIVISGDTDVTALWYSQWVLSFDKGDNPQDTSRDSEAYKHGTTISIPDNTFTAPSGSNFKGWKLKDAKGERLVVVDQSYTIKSDVLLTALWSQANEISFDNGGNGATGDMPKRVEPNGDFVLPEPMVDADHFVAPRNRAFKGWKIVDPDGNPYGDKSEALPGEIIKLDGPVKLVALWVDVWNIRFDANTGSGTMENADLYIDSDDTTTVERGHYYTLPPNTFVAPTEPTGRKFVAWSIGDETRYVPGDRVLITKDTVIKAEWTPCFTVRYIANDDEADGKLNPVEPQLLAAKGKVVVRKPTFKKVPEYSKFKGWLYNGVPKKPGVDEIDVYADITLEGLWEISYKVVFELNDRRLFPLHADDLATTPAAQLIKGGEKIDQTKIGTPKLWRYEFLGWYEKTDDSPYSSEAVAKPFDFNTKIQRGYVLYARWGKKQVADRAALVKEIYGSNDDTAHAEDAALHDPRWTTYQELNYIDTSKVESFKHLFSAEKADYSGSIVRHNWNSAEGAHLEDHALNFNGDISTWDISNATDLSYMFFGAREFNSNVNTKIVPMYDGKEYLAWDTRNAEWLAGMFHNAQVFNQPLNNWDTAKVKSLFNTFLDTSAFNQPLDNWNTESVTNMYQVFCASRTFNGDISTWNTSKVTNMSGFVPDSHFNGDLSRKKLTDHVFSYPDPTAPNKVRKVTKTYMAWDTSNVTNMEWMFGQDFSFEGRGLDTWAGHIGKVTNINNIFSDCTNLNVDLSSWHLPSGIARSNYDQNTFEWEGAKKPKFDL